MDFSLDETQQAVQHVVAEVLGRERERLDHAPPATESGTLPGGRVPSGASSGATYDETAWKALGGAGMLALPLPERVGGEGLGLLEASLVLREIGRTTAPVPASAAFAAAVFAARHAGPDQQERWLRGLASGEAFLSCAPAGASALPGSSGSVSSSLRAERTAGGWRLRGAVPGVCHAGAAGRILLPAHVDGTAGQRVVAAVTPGEPGVGLRSGTASAGAESTVVLDDAVVDPGDVVGAPAASEPDTAATELQRLFVAACCAVADGALAGALELTTEHVRTREQFGRPLATFQEVAAQTADVYIAARTLHLAVRRACWRLHHGLPADEELAVAAYWATAQAPPAVHTCHHLHGGTGVDATHPLHRHYAWIKDATRLLGGSARALDGLAGVMGASDGADGVAAADGADATGAAPHPARTTGPGGAGSARPDSSTDATGSTGMVIDLDDELRELRDELRAYFEGLIAPEEHEAMLTERHGETYRAIVRRLGRDGWLGVGWPEEYGGRGFGTLAQQIFVNEAARADVPLPQVTLQTVGPTLQEHGTAEQRQTFLPRILSGDAHFAIGYTEPGAGTDLAALRTTAVRNGDEYVINGQKTFTTGAHDADYIWLACRTDPEAPKHKGISILIVDTTAPGFSWTPIITCDGAHHVNATYFDNVRVPPPMLVGEENDGWRLITTQLNHERVMLGPAGKLAGLLHPVIRWAAGQHTPDGSRVLDILDVRRALADAQACLSVNETLNWQVAASAAAGPVQVADASATKVFTSEHLQRVGRSLEEVVGCHGDPGDPATAELLRWLDVQARRNLVLTFGGGVNEIQRELIATAGLGLPRVPR